MLNAQIGKTVTDVEQVWLGVFNQTRVSDKWGFWIDVQLRTRDEFFNKYSQSLNRFGLTYYLTDNTKLTAGYAYVVAFPEDNRKVSIPEHRPWQQVQWHTKYGKKRMMQWFRLDERYRRKLLNDSTLADGNNFNFKLRYNIFYDIPLSSKGIVPNSLSFVVNDEVHVNFGKQIVYNTFDQNRFFLGFKYQFTEHNNLQLGYMNLFQQLASGNRYRSIHAARLFYFHNLDLRKKTQK
jgi:hypothetical protein